MANEPTANDGTGDCFPTALDVATTLAAEVGPDVDVHVVHAIVTGRGNVAGSRFWHAWVETSRTIRVPATVFDPDAGTTEIDLDGDPTFVEISTAVDRSNGLDVEIPAALYRHISDHGELRRYTVAEATAAALAFGHYGPWDDEHPPVI